MEFELEGKHVIDDHQKKIGKVSDYIVDVDSFVVQQLVVKRPLLKSFSDDELIVHRSQIVEITDDRIIIKSGRVKAKAVAKESRHYVNPFRQTNPQPEAARIDTKD
jgi:sporulation protein YlmC with PRC-barrel domain